MVSAPNALLSNTNATKSLLDLRVAVGSARVVRLYRCYHMSMMLGIGLGAKPFVLARIQGSGNTSDISPIPLKNTNTPILPDVNAGTARTYTETGILRQYIRFNSGQDTAVIPADKALTWQIDVPMMLIWNAGYGDANIQPLTLRGGEGMHVRQGATAGATGFMNELDFEFTVDIA